MADFINATKICWLQSFACTKTRSELSTDGVRAFRCVQETIPSTSRSTSAFVFPACKHTRTRSFPSGTVGHEIGRALSPSSRRCADRGRGLGVMMGMMGDWRSGGGVIARWGGRQTTLEGNRDSCWRNASKVYVIRACRLFAS